MFYGGTAVKYAKADVSASTTASQLVAASSGNRIRVLGLYLMTGGTATSVTINSASTAISGQFQAGANGGIVLPTNPLGWMETATGEALTVTTGSGSTTAVGVVYVLVPRG